MSLIKSHVTSNLSHYGRKHWIDKNY